MKSTSSLVLLSMVVLLFSYGCRKNETHIMSQREFEDVMIDIYKGESYADLSFNEFREDSSKRALRQAIFNRHGITQADYDSTLMYYGHNINKYLAAYDNIISRLEQEVEEAGNVEMMAGSVVGDSVDAWAGSNSYVVSRRSPSQFLKFRFDYDDTWENGDTYTWQFKAMNRLMPIKMGMYVDYDDGSTDMIYQESETDGWNRLMVVVDSTRTPLSVYGFVDFDLRGNEEIFIDSLSLVRKRFDPVNYRKRYAQTRFRNGK